MSPVQKALIAVGVALILVALAWPLVSKLGLFRLPGDIRIEREGFGFYFPLTTMILISVLLTGGLALSRWLGR